METHNDSERSILFVCTGNTCRSPMAAGWMERLCPAVSVTSAGIAADGSPVTAEAVAVMAEAGVDIAGKRSCQLTEEMCRAAGTIAVMTDAHAAWLLQKWEIPSDKVVVLNVPDPFGGSMEEYRAARDAIREAIEEKLANV